VAFNGLRDPFLTFLFTTFDFDFSGKKKNVPGAGSNILRCFIIFSWIQEMGTIFDFPFFKKNTKFGERRDF